MANLGASTAWGLVVAASLVAGALVAALVELPSRVAATITAFGGGVLLAAVALQLVPAADSAAGPGLTAAGLAAGTLAYVGADVWLTRDPGTREMRRMGHAMVAGRARPMADEAAEGEVVAAGIFVDGVPESIALGLTVAGSGIGVALLVGVLLGNLVESYGSAHLIVHGGRPRRFAITLLTAIGLALGFATVLGGTALADASDKAIGAAQAVSAGAILAVVSIAIIPHTFSEVSRRVAIATMLGFLGGYLLST
jgi:zinc transporter, ZIP family